MLIIVDGEFIRQLVASYSYRIQDQVDKKIIHGCLPNSIFGVSA